MRLITKVAGWLVTLTIGTLVVISGNYADATRTPSGPSSDVLPSGDALFTELRLEERGFRCTEQPQLTDRIIVDTASQGAIVVTMNQAFRLAESGGWIRSYCK